MQIFQLLIINADIYLTAKVDSILAVSGILAQSLTSLLMEVTSGTAGATETSSTSLVPSDFVGPALVAAFVSGVIAIIQFYWTSRQKRDEHLLEVRKTQAKEFYGPILLLLAEDHALISTVREACGAPVKDWYLVDYLEEIRKNPELQPIVERIGEVNLEIHEILKNKSGLTFQPTLPDSYFRFISHANFMHQSIKHGRALTGVGTKVFPKEFEAEIQQSHETLVKVIKESLRDN